MIIKKIWHLSSNNLTKEDFIWITGLDCEYKIQQEDPVPIHAANGNVYQYVGVLPKLTIVTTCEKQESMLKLKYGDDLLLLQSYHTTIDRPTVFSSYL